MSKKKKFTQEQIISAIKKAEGFISQAAQILDCDISTVYDYINRYPKVKEARESVKHRRDDFVESKMMTRIKEGSDTMIIFYAKTQMKHRGYVERTDVNQTSINIDYTTLTDKQLERLARGDNPIDVITGG